MMRHGSAPAFATSMNTSGLGVSGALDAERPVDAGPKFKLHVASDSMLLALKSDGPPERKTWNAQEVLARTSTSLFRLKAIELPKLEERPGVGTSYSHNALFEHAAAQLKRGAGGLSEASAAGLVALGQRRRSSVEASLHHGPPQKRADKYFQLLMKHYNRRCDNWDDEAEEEARAKAEGAASAAKRAALEKERKRKAAEAAASASRDTSETEEDSEEEQPSRPLETHIEEEELGPMVPYDGIMKVDIEVVVMRAPGVSESSSSVGAGSLPESARGSSAASGRAGAGAAGAPGGSREGSTGRQEESQSQESTPRMDLANALEELKEELGVVDNRSDQNEDDDDVPDGLKLKKNIFDNPMPRWSLGIGGSVFFVPDAERYALGPSLPPPPPPSLQGRRRLRLKPRLPLEISNHRYRDEHPNIWPEPPYSPGIQDYLRFEQQLLTLDLYQSCNKALAGLPKLQNLAEEKKHRTMFGRTVDQEIKRSQAWKNWNHRENLKRKENDKKEKDALAAARAAEQEAADAAMRAALESED